MRWPSIGKQILLGRVEAGLRQIELAARLGCTQQFLSQIENGVTPAPMRLIARLPDAIRARVRDALHAEIDRELGDDDG